jgi:diguanylate cyclase (GGDEF)-like protein/PAS domain S-box-containing protein
MDELELNSLYRSVIDNAMVAIGLTDTEGKFILVNYAWCQKLGYSPNDANLLSLKDITMPEDSERSAANFRKLVKGEVDGIQKLTRYQRRNGTCFWANLFVAPVKDQFGRVNSVLGIWHDVDSQLREETSLKGLDSVADSATEKLMSAQSEILKKEMELQNAYHKLDELAYTDVLTELPNRRHMEDMLQNEAKRTSRTKREFSICICDIDDFKKINDSYGHDVGDMVLKEVSAIFQNCIRTTDSVGRWGGEEFLFILTETPLKGSYIVMERVRQEVEQHKFINGETEIKVTVTLGASTYEPDSELENIIKQADLALYAGKKSGKNLAIEYTKQLEVIHSIYI